jgi:hypothetical protein
MLDKKKTLLLLPFIVFGRPGYETIDIVNYGSSGSGSAQGGNVDVSGASDMRNGGQSTHNIKSTLFKGEKGSSYSKQTGSPNSPKTVNILDKIYGNALKYNNVKQVCGKGSKCNINDVTKFTGDGGTKINKFNNYGNGSVNSAVDDSRAKGSTLMNFVSGGKDDIKTDRRGNTIMTINSAPNSQLKVQKLS